MRSFNHRFVSLVIALGCWIASTGHAAAKETAKPRVILNTDGPVSEVRSLRFSADSKRLYAAGLDKVIHAWEIGWGQRDGKPPATTLTRTLHWEIARGNRGGIYSMATDFANSIIAIGGNSARQQTGDIALLDEDVGRVITSLPSPEARLQANKDETIGTEGHRYSVVSLDFSPSGASLLSRDENGGMFVWRRNDRTNYLAERLDPSEVQTGLARFRPVGIFLTDDKIVFSSRETGNNVRLIQRNLKTGSEVRFPESYPRRVAALTRDPANGSWASADDMGNINLTSLSDPSKRSLLRATLPHVTEIQFGGNDLMAVMSCESIDGSAGRVVIDLFNTINRKRLDFVELAKSSSPSRSLAISPDGSFLAAVKEDPKEVLVYSLLAASGRLANKPLSGRPPAISRPNSDAITLLARSPDGKSIAFGNDSLNERRVLNFNVGEISSDAAKTKDWAKSGIDPDGWSVQRLDHPTQNLLIRGPNGTTSRIALDRAFQGTYTSHCFLFASGNSDAPVGIAVGTENIDGIFVYEFVGGSGGSGIATRMVRWFRDHTDDVTAILPSLDQQLLFSGSLDRTMKAWFIGDLFKETAPRTNPSTFSQQSFWGCEFQLENDQVIVRNIDSRGIAFARSLRDGDRIVKVQGYDARNNSNTIGAAAPGDSGRQMLDILNRVSVLNQVLIFAQSESKAGQGPGNLTADKQFIIRPAYEPLVTAFANRLGEWILWHPDGFFNASAAEGGGLLRWLVNRGQNEPPRILEGGFLSRDLERPEVIQKLLSGVSLQEAMQDIAAIGQQPQRKNELAESIDATPDVIVLTPIVGEEFLINEATEVVATIDFGTSDPAEFDVRATIDGVRLSVPKRTAIQGSQFRYVWQAKPTGKLNQVEVVATENSGSLVSHYGADVIYRRGKSNDPPSFDLHILSLASEKYGGPLASQRNGFGKLEFPIDDVVAVLDLLKTKQERGKGKYKIAGIRELRDDAITPQSVRAEIIKLNDDVSSSKNPLLAIYLSGHGTTIDGQFYYVTTKSKSADRSALRQTCVPWSLLREAGMPGCRVVYLIDTCHSGSAVDAKSSIRDPLRSGGIVIAAASGREAAQELSPLGHGCFTYSVLEALRGKADGVVAYTDDLGLPVELLSTVAIPDGTVDLNEMVAFVRDYVPQLTAGQQRPSATPSRLTKTLAIPLVLTE